MARGFLQVARIKGVGIRVHWTTPIGLFVFGGFGFAPIVWAGLLFIILVHEAGHAVLARALGLWPRTIDVHGAGGRCIYEGRPSDVQRSVIAWGGVLAQALVFVVARRVGELFAEVGGPRFELTISLLTFANAVFLVVNLLPIPGLDGAAAWPLFRWRNISAAVGRTARSL
jgi:Zn-dependent protease